MQRKESAVVTRCAHVFGPLTPMSDDVMEFLYSKPEGPYKFVTVLSDKARQLLEPISKLLAWLDPL